jgi:CTP:molybdopterin cytidylyltransferase MocA
MGITSQKIPVSFWTINPQTENEHSNEVANQAFTEFDVHSIEEIIVGQSHSLDAYALEDTPEYITGALVRSRNTGLPLAYARRKKEFGPLPLSTDQGLGRVNCFVFEKRRRILLIEGSSKSSATAFEWCTYFRTMMLKKSGRLPALLPSIVRRLDARHIFDSFTRYTELRVRLARLRDVSMFQNEADRKMLTASFKAADASGSDEVNCVFKVPNRPPARRQTDLAVKPSLNRGFVRRLVDACEALGPGEVIRLEVAGEEPDVERIRPLDLLADRVKDTIAAVPFTDKELPNPTVVRHRCELIKELFGRHAQVLQSVGGV